MAKQKPPTRQEILEMIQQSFKEQINEHALKERDANRAEINAAFELYMKKTRENIEDAIRMQVPVIAGKAFHDVLYDKNITINGQINCTDSIVGHITETRKIVQPFAEEMKARELSSAYWAKWKNKPVIKTVSKLQHQRWFQWVILLLSLQFALWLSKKIDPDQDSKPAQVIKQMNQIPFQHNE